MVDLVRHRQMFPRLLFSEIMFVQNYFGSLWEHQHTWSLAIEEHFYLILTGVFILLAKWKGNTANPFCRLPKIFLVVAVVSLASRWISVCRQNPGFMNANEWTHCRIDSLMFGVVLSYYWHYLRAWSFPYWQYVIGYFPLVAVNSAQHILTDGLEIISVNSVNCKTE